MFSHFSPIRADGSHSTDKTGSPVGPLRLHLAFSPDAANFGHLLRHSCGPSSLWCQWRASGLDKSPPHAWIPALSVSPRAGVAVCPPSTRLVGRLSRPLRVPQASGTAETCKTHWNAHYMCLFRGKFSFIIITGSYVHACTLVYTSVLANVCVCVCLIYSGTTDNNSYISSCLSSSFVVAFPGLLFHCWVGSTATLI